MLFRLSIFAALLVVAVPAFAEEPGASPNADPQVVEGQLRQQLGQAIYQAGVLQTQNALLQARIAKLKSAAARPAEHPVSKPPAKR